MGIKSFFKNLGRSISKGFNNFVSGAGSAIGGAATFLQRKAIPAIAGGATKVSGLLGKAAPLLAAGGPEAAAAGAEAAQVAGKVGDVVGKFGKFIGSDLPTQGTPMNAQQIAAFKQSPLGKAFTGRATAAAAAPAPAPFAKAAAAAVSKPLLGGNPATYSPSGIEAEAANKPKLAVVGGPLGMSRMVM